MRLSIMETIRFSNTRLNVCLVLLLIATGCAKTDANRGTITGQVKLDGQPLEQGSILFTPAEGVKGVVTGGEIKDGKYQLTGKAGPSIGSNRVEIRAVRKSGKMVQKPMAPAGEMVEEMAEAVAPQFNSASTLKFDVKAGDNTADFEVKSK
jgi:hypothetical protein